MKKSKLLNSFVYIFSIFTITIFSITTYYKFSNSKKSNLGFKEAKAVTNNDEICVGDINNIECHNKLLENFNETKNSLLFFGNSQTGAINNFNLGDHTFITYLNQLFKLNKKEFEGKVIWLANANMKEFEVIYKSLKKCCLEPSFLVIPVFFDDMRIYSIRNELNNFSDYLCGDILNIELEENTNVGNLAKVNLQINKKIDFIDKLKSLNERFRIDMYKLRNLVLNIKPETIRPMKKGPYKNNLISLKNIINERNTRDLKTIIYIPPLLFSNKKNKIPYSIKDYEIFKDEIKEICDSEQCIYYNLERSIPTSLWGLKASTTFNNDDFELDFMHFTSEGHKILADIFAKILSSHLNIN